MSEDHRKISYNKIFTRNIGIYTPEMQELLKKSTVAIGGVGGPGGMTAITLARNGLGHLKIADPDMFEEHNINRQPAAFISTLGQKKVYVLEEILKDINPHIKVSIYPEGVRKKNVDQFIDDADVVVDAIDYTAPEDKLALYRGAREAGLYVLSSPISGFGSLVFCFDPHGMTVEEVFGFPHNEKAIKEHKIPPKKLIGCKLDYVAPNFFDVVASGIYCPTNASACDVASAAVTIDILKILMLRKRKQYPHNNIFAHLESIPLTVVPYARRYDLWDCEKDKIVDVRKVEEYHD